MLFLEEACGDLHGPCGRPSVRGHHVGDPWTNIYFHTSDRLPVRSFQLLDSDIAQSQKWLISCCWTAQTNSHLFTPIQFIGMSFWLQIASRRQWTRSALHRQDIYSPQWLILCVMVHVLYNIAFTATDVASKLLNFSKRKLLEISSNGKIKLQVKSFK